MRVEELVSLRLRGDGRANNALGYWIQDLAARCARFAPDFVREDVEQDLSEKILRLTTAWKPELGSFGVYAHWCAGRISREFIDREIHLIKLPRHLNPLRNHIRKTDAGEFDPWLFPARLDWEEGTVGIDHHPWVGSDAHHACLDMLGHEAHYALFRFWGGTTREYLQYESNTRYIAVYAAAIRSRISG